MLGGRHFSGETILGVLLNPVSCWRKHCRRARQYLGEAVGRGAWSPGFLVVCGRLVVRGLVVASWWFPGGLWVLSWQHPRGRRGAPPLFGGLRRHKLFSSFLPAGELSQESRPRPWAALLGLQLSGSGAQALRRRRL